MSLLDDVFVTNCIVKIVDSLSRDMIVTSLPGEDKNVKGSGVVTDYALRFISLKKGETE